jgi:hypothetical protein
MLQTQGVARWITAVAVDSQGLVSQPSAVRPPGRPTARAQLRAVLVGADRYDDRAKGTSTGRRHDRQYPAMCADGK